MEEDRCERCGRALAFAGEGPGVCEDCDPDAAARGRALWQIAANLRGLRLRAGIERRELARRAALRPVEVARLEGDGVAGGEPRVGRALRLAHSLGASIEELVEGIYWNPGEVAPKPSRRRPSSQRLAGFFLVPPPGVPAFGPSPPREPLTDRHEAARIFGARLRDARQRRRLTQRALAGAAGLSKAGLSLIERGVHETTTGRLLALSRALEVPPELLLEGIGWEPAVPLRAPPAHGGARSHAAGGLDQPLRRMWEEGRTAPEIAAALGVSPGSVSTLVHRLRESGEAPAYRRPPTRSVHAGARRRRERRPCPPSGRRDQPYGPPPPEAGIRDPSTAELAARIAANVTRRREEAGLTRRQLAEAAEIERTYVIQIERGEHLPRLGVIVRLAASLNVRCGLIVAGIRWEPGAGAFRLGADPEQGPAARLGENALAVRRRLGVAQQALAERAAISRDDVVDFERAKRSFRLFTVVKLAAALEVGVSRLFAGVPDWYVRPLPPPELAPGDRQPSRAERDLLLARLWREGRSEREIAERMELSVSAVGPYVRELRDRGVELPYRREPRR